MPAARLLAFCLLMVANKGFAQTTLEVQLFDLPDVVFQPVKVPNGFEQAYELLIRQPLDHQHPEGPSYYQRVMLSHRGFDRPTVIITEGYHAPGNRIYELTGILHANQVRVEHRFFGVSLPDSLDYRYLNMFQACSDLHRVRELLGHIYKQKWVSTGISKGGMTTIYYKYYHPRDVAVAVPYVAPIDTAFEDLRIYDFLGTVGTTGCRDSLQSVQERLLEDREAALLRLKWYARGKGWHFDYLGFDQAFEFGVLEMPFSFWQMGHRCADIPDARTTSMDELLVYYNELSGLSLFSDEEIEQYGSHYYQAATETGYYGYQTAPFKGLLKAVPERPHAAFVPMKMPVSYHPELSRDVFRWTQKRGNHLIYIYGETDTWTAAGVPASDQVDSYWFVMPGRNHGDARIRNMSETNQARIYEVLGRWLDMEVPVKFGE